MILRILRLLDRYFKYKNLGSARVPGNGRIPLLLHGEAVHIELLEKGEDVLHGPVDHRDRKACRKA